jgi:hypothetical protein
LKVPYRERRGIRRHLVSRVEKRKRKKRQYITSLLIFIFLLVSVYLLQSLILKRTPKKPIVSEKKEEISSFSFLIAGEREEKEGLVGVIAAYYNKEDEEVNSLFIPPETLIEVPKVGFGKVGEVPSKDLRFLALGIRNFLGVDFDYKFLVSEEDFSELLSGRDFSKAVKEAKGDAGEKKGLLVEKLSKVPSDKRKIAALPTESIKMGEQSFVEPKREEIEKLAILIWGESSHALLELPKVIILNGCGVPGIGGEVAGKLIENGFRVVDIKNASNFNYYETIISFSTDKRRKAEKVKELLGVGILKRENITSGFVDITVIVGADYAKKTTKTQGR